MTMDGVSYSITVPEKRQLRALRDIEYRLAMRLREVRDEAGKAIDWAKQNGQKATRYERIKTACEDALEFQRARKRQAKASYVKERGPGLEGWEVP